jgi:NhaP-type Na+/H+ or K+/H+ antiporter
VSCAGRHLATGARLKFATELFLGWFRTRGLVSVLCALLVSEETDIDLAHSVMMPVILTATLSIEWHHGCAICSPLRPQATVTKRVTLHVRSARKFAKNLLNDELQAIA